MSTYPNIEKTMQVIIASDLHIISEHDERAQYLLKIISDIDNDHVKYFILNGDVFDFCLGSSDFYRKKFAKIGRALSSLAEKGTQVIYLQGNHEFDIDKLGWPGVCFITSKDYILPFSKNTHIAFSHGDLLSSPWHYHYYIRFLRSPFVMFLVSLIPGKLLDSLSLYFSSFSRDSQKNRVFPKERILAAINSWVDTLDCQHAVVGHFHYPFDEQRGSGAGRIMSVESWDRPNYLVFDGAAFKRVFQNNS